MLSIGKIGGGQGDPRYYIDNVANGREDYYTGGGEAEGEWYGAGAAAKGLSGTVGEDEFLGSLEIEPGSQRKILGFDLTFSAPKSVSLVYGIGDRDVARAAREAHDEAARQALGYLERNACFTRRNGGKERLSGEGLVVSMFRHRTSRAGDPQLHTHAVVANSTRAGDRWGALDGRALYAHARTAGFLYQAALRHELTASVGVDWEPVRNGVAEIRGFDREVLRHFSRRSEDIRSRMAELGYRSSRAAELATLETRRTKKYDVPIHRLRDEWRARASELGLGRDELHAILDRRAAGRPIEPPLEDVAAEMRSLGGLTREASTFDRREVLRDWASAHREGARVDRLEELADGWLASDAAVPLESPDTRRPGGRRYSTPDMLQLERRLIDDARARRDDGVALADTASVEAALEDRPQLSDEQAEMVRSLTRSGDGVQVVRAAAGTGKTYALAVARDVWESCGIRVYGCALAARAALELESQAGIDSTTIAHVRADLRQGYGLARDSVLVVDEAGMAGTRAIGELADHAREIGAKLVLVGDDRQLPELDAGGAYRGLADRLGAIELRRVQRQREDWDRAALSELRRGNVEDWAERYRDAGRIVSRSTARATRQALVDDWWQAAREPDVDAVMVAHRRVDVADLNARARARMREDRRLGQDEVTVGDRSFSTGDRVIAKQNDRAAGLVNGARGIVREVDVEASTVKLELDDGRGVAVERSYLDDGNLDHAYAVTAHAAQGATVDRAFVLGSDDLYREWGYTALSRHRDEARFYVVSPGSVERCLPGLEPETDVVTKDLVDMLGHSRRKELASDVLDRGDGDAVPDGPRAKTRDRTSDAVERADRAAAEARQRAAALEAERAAVKPWRRKRRAELAEIAETHERALTHWEEEGARARSRLAESSEELMPEPAIGIDGLDVSPLAPDELRALLVDPSASLTAEVGERPLGLGGRDAWTHEASRLLVIDVPQAPPPEPVPDLDLDVGLEL